ncbi:hypothetical protein EFJ78_04610 [Pediococcus pentosaceus]|nr:hypothetical protein [Pediococcus pentosaceus]MCS8567413.1 hypothetical protein [Pediococcus pentosaceus]MCS8580967.1 hypothetical protein [Pediococcus pentosaceus]
MACKNSFLLRDDLFIIPSLKSCLRNQLTSNKDALKIRYDKLLSDDQILKNKVGVNAIIWYVLEKSMNCKY